jgi:hypothetical protein
MPRGRAVDCADVTVDAAAISKGIISVDFMLTKASEIDMKRDGYLLKVLEHFSLKYLISC